MYVSRYVTLTI